MFGSGHSLFEIQIKSTTWLNTGLVGMGVYQNY
jgi:hypothetical protein